MGTFKCSTILASILIQICWFVLYINIYTIISVTKIALWAYFILPIYNIRQYFMEQNRYLVMGTIPAKRMSSGGRQWNSPYRSSNHEWGDACQTDKCCNMITRLILFCFIWHSFDSHINSQTVQHLTENISSPFISLFVSYSLLGFVSV